VQFKGLKPFKTRFLGKGFNNFAFAFSGFSVDAQGVSAIDDGKRIAWQDVTDFGIGSEQMGRIFVDVFFVQFPDTRIRTRSGLLENAHILQALCAEMVQKNQIEGEELEAWRKR
jgi:hypothetical protein